MMYWHAHVGGLGELVPSLFRYYGDLMDDFRGNARKLYGCRGIYIPAGTTPGIGTPNQIVPVILNWTGAPGGSPGIITSIFVYGRYPFLREEARRSCAKLFNSTRISQSLVKTAPIVCILRYRRRIRRLILCRRTEGAGSPDADNR